MSGVAFPKPVSYPKKRRPLKAKRRGPRRSSRVRDKAFMAFVRTLPCSASSHFHGGPIEAHHAGDRGLSQKCSDLETVPLCQKHHREWTDNNGTFGGYCKADRRMLARVWIRETQEAHARAGQEPTP